MSKPMPLRLPSIRYVAIGCILLQSAGVSVANTCVKFHKRVPLKAVCGHVINQIGERPDGVKLTLENGSGRVLFTARVDEHGRFVFGPLPKGDYTLRAAGPGYKTEERQVRVTRDKDKRCKPRIEVILGVNSCNGGTYVKGFDKKKDLWR